MGGVSRAAPAVASAGARILCVEDNGDLQFLLRERLEWEGFTVEVAMTRAQGLERLGAGGIDLVLLDLMLPDGSGLDVLRALRQGRAAPALPVIVLSGRSDDETTAEALALGAHRFLVKGQSLDAVVQAVRELL